jgi:ABC-type cobalamin/Fe3+-siderophores transport system ATPase subunit
LDKALLSARKLAVGYDGKALIHDIDLELRRGEIVTLIGPNGAGKSTILKSIARQIQLLGGDVFIAEASGYEGVKNAVVLRTADGLVVDVHDYLRKRVYKVLSTPSGVAVQEIEAKGRGKCGCDTLRPRISEDAQPVAKAKSARRLLSAGAEDTYVDILVAYEQNASTWVKSYGGGMTNFAQTAVQKMNAALANTGLASLFRFRLVGVIALEVNGGNDLNGVLDAVQAGNGAWAPVKAKRNEVGADVVTTLIDTGSAGGSTGLGFSLRDTDFQGFSEHPYNVCAVRAVARSHTMTHEVGHNLGAGHAVRLRVLQMIGQR